MRRSLGFQQQCYADEGTWMETQAQQQSHAIHEESWSSGNNYRKQFPGMHMNRLGAFALDSELSMPKQHGKLGGSHGMFQEGMHSDHGFGYAHGGGRKFPSGGNNASHHFPNGGAKFNSGGHREYFSEETEYEEAYTEEHVGAKVDEMRYQHHNWGGDTCYISPYDRN
ncbi:hypothetical protein E2542_SST29748 [Spatholobus suberectus]|nr:hypothetical protein E2542_SST29748 [Spatholobus suberectus]